MISQDIVDKIAQIFCTAPQNISFQDEAFIYATPLDLDGVFFDGISQVDIEAYINDFTINVISDGHFSIKANSSHEYYEFYKVKNLNKQLSHGMYTISGNGAMDDCIVFTGEFDSGLAQLDLTDTPEFIFSILLFNPPSNYTMPASVSWDTVFSAVGSFVFVKSNAFDIRTLYPYGFFFDSGAYSVSYEKEFKYNEIEINTAVVKSINNSIPATVLEPALKAYSNVLLTNAAIELDFVNLHRVFEILYAWALKKYIASISEVLIYDRINKNGKNGGSPLLTSERSMTCYIVEHSGVSSLSNFTSQDMLDLFGVATPVDFNAKGSVKSWVVNNANVAMNAEFVGEVLYFVRCALVHSKVRASEMYLMGPFSAVQTTALKKLVRIQRDILERLLYM
ncbi:hypothetical protein [Aeromonas veronii]|uniref:hypothetical protein n=1 Tax=Aeromonas veronii TaxID=654 RepID=UPI003BA0B763